MISASRGGGESRPENGSAPVRLALIDADSAFVHVVGRRLTALGWPHRVVGGPIPIQELVAMRLHALVIDLAAVGPDAWEYLERVCGALPGLAVVVCTGQSTVAQRVRGLRAGADDWMGKPGHPEELVARVQAVVRRRRHSEIARAPEALVSGELEIRPDQFQAFVDGRSLDLTRREYELLALLAGAEGQVLEREAIYERVWGYAMAHGDRSVDVFVRKLRQKLERAGPGWRYIHTHFGIGYRFAAECFGGPGEPSPSPRAAPERARDRVREPAPSAAR